MGITGGTYGNLTGQSGESAAEGSQTRGLNINIFNTMLQALEEQFDSAVSVLPQSCTSYDYCRAECGKVIREDSVESIHEYKESNRRPFPPVLMNEKVKTIKWREMIRGSAVEDDLPAFISLMKNECKSETDEMDIGTMVSDELLLALNDDDTKRALRIVQAIIEAGFVNVQEQIALECRPHLEHLQRGGMFGTVVQNIIQQLPPASPRSVYPVPKQSEKQSTRWSSHIPIIVAQRGGFA